MLWTCAQVGNSGTGMYPRGATAHGCSFAPVADFGYSKTSKLLESLMCDASEYLSQADTSCRPSKLCKRQFTASNHFLTETHLTCSKVVLPQPLLPALGLSALCLPVPSPCQRGHSLWQKERPWTKKSRRSKCPTGFIRSASAPLYFSCKDQLTSVSDRNVP